MKLNRLNLLTVAALLPVASYAQGTTAQKAAAPALCLITGENIPDTSAAAAKYEIGGKAYYVCCGGCKAKVDKATEAQKVKLAKITDLRTEKVVLEARVKAVNAELATLTKETIAKPATTAIVPIKVAGPKDTVYCAVTDEEIGTPDKATGKAVYNGKMYYFCCDGCKPQFEKNPAKFAALADKKNAERAAKQ